MRTDESIGRSARGGRASVAASVALALLATAAALPPDAYSLEPAATRTRIFVIPSGANKKGRPTVALANPTAPEELSLLDETMQGILARELFRQALLIAARDELGLATRDEVLGDPTAAAAKEPPNAELATVFHLRPGSTSQVVLHRATGGRDETLVNRDAGAIKQPYGDLATLAQTAEALSRNEFPAALKMLGLNGKRNAQRSDLGLPAGAEGRLAHLGLVDIFAALRDLHEAIRTSGESPARLGALVRGYALLGLITEHHWHPAHKVFKARALLYAQRLMTRDPKDAFGLWHRAFAAALIGLHRDALADVALARERSNQARTPGPPAWGALIEAYSSADISRMTVARGPLSALAAMLRLASLEHPVMPDLTLLAAKDVLALEPDCYRAADAMCRVGGVINLHQATTVGMETLTKTLPATLRDLESLPAAVRQLLDNPDGGESALYKAFRRAAAPGADGGEPSWAVLGRLISETRFVQVYRRLNFLVVGLGVNPGEFWVTWAQAVAEHPYRPFMWSILELTPQSTNTRLDLIEHLDVANLQIVSNEMLQVLEQTQQPRARVARQSALKHVDNNAHDLAELLSDSEALDQPRIARALLAVSPKSSYAKAVIVEKDWDRAKPHLADWERDASSAPALLAAFAKRYNDLGKIDLARRALLRYIQFSADYWAYELLAKTCKDQGDLEQWQATLEEYIAKAEDHALDHARVRVELANHFMGLKQWEKAWPFAKAAAESGAQWALMCAERCAEAKEDWKEAGRYAEAVSKRYGKAGWFQWFLFCKRTGHGDVESARVHAETYLQTIDLTPQKAAPGPIGHFYWLCGDAKQAMPWFRKAYQASPSDGTCYNMILVADDAGDTATRDEMIRVLLANYRKKAPKACQIYELLRKSLERDDTRSIDLKPIDEILQSATPESRAINAYHVGLFLKNHANPEAAQRYLRMVVESRGVGVNEWGRTHAIVALREMEDHSNPPRALSGGLD
jgi:tetratricopeptide (TPR) repeat protein